MAATPPAAAPPPGRPPGRPPPDRPPHPPAGPRSADPPAGHPGWWQRRRARVAEEIARNRRGGHRVPTWVLALILVGFVAAWAAVIVLA